MSFLIGLLTVTLVLDCLLLILLVLIQLPKKEAGAGIAFGGAAADALFGAGTGNVLTKTTKYATITFFLLLLMLGYLQSVYYHKSTAELRKALEQNNNSLVQPTTPPAPGLAATNVPSAPSLTLTNPVTAPTAPAPAPVPVPVPQK